MTKIFENKVLPEGFRLGCEEDIPLIVLTFAQAFADSNYPVPSNQINHSALLRMNYELGGYMVLNAIKKGVVLTNEDFSAILVTVDLQDACEIPLDKICETLHTYGTEENAIRAKEIFTHIEEMEEKLSFGNNVTYIEAFAVQTQHQGKKLGSSLMRKLIKECTDIGNDLFLFTNTERNVSIYKHFGFETVYEEYSEKLESYTAFMYYKTSQIKQNH